MIQRFLMNRNSKNKVSESIVDLSLIISNLIYEYQPFFQVLNDVIIIYLIQTETFLRRMIYIVDRNSVDGWNPAVLGELLHPRNDREHKDKIRHPLRRIRAHFCMAEHAVVIFILPVIELYYGQK